MQSSTFHKVDYISFLTGGSFTFFLLVILRYFTWSAYQFLRFHIGSHRLIFYFSQWKYDTTVFMFDKQNIRFWKSKWHIFCENYAAYFSKLFRSNYFEKKSGNIWKEKNYILRIVKKNCLSYSLDKLKGRKWGREIVQFVVLHKINGWQQLEMVRTMTFPLNLKRCCRFFLKMKTKNSLILIFFKPIYLSL